MEVTEVRIGKEVLLDIGTHSEWFISSVGYNGESVDITLRRKADIDKDWWHFVDIPQTDQPKMTEEEIDTMLARVLVSGQTDCGWK